MADSPQVVKARTEAAIAREKLLLSTHALQERVAPSRLANNALATARERGHALLDTVSDTTRKRPGVAAGVALGLIAFLARHRIGRAFHRPKKHKLAVPARHALPRPFGDDK
jgi:hypothetical protein